MRILIVEDDFVSRQVLLEHLSPHGSCSVAVDGREAVEAVRIALDQGETYDLICLDIMMPNMNGHEALKSIRESEKGAGLLLGQGSKVFMTTALSDKNNVMDAFRENADAYVVKPIEKAKLNSLLDEFGLIS